MEVHENATPIIGQPGHSAHRLVMKTEKPSSLILPDKASTGLLTSLETRDNKLYAKVKKTIKDISWIRLENNSLLGTPDLLGYNNSGHFFTVELKVCKGNKIRFSPHQISLPCEASTQYIYHSRGPWSEYRETFPWFTNHGA